MPNDVDLNGTTRQVVILTGPNMGGKSTYLRQTALMPLLAQIGSFVPARDAKLPLVDRIFARVGASDNIARGHSTFMVEMQETAHILHTATSRSLVVLDEIGRGTSTFDGLSIAWAVAEYLASPSRQARPKTLFATHYHELTDLADALPGVVNAHVAAREWKDDIIFLRKIIPGRADRSYGIQVARLAGLPPVVIARAKEILDGPRTRRAVARRPADAVGRDRGRRAAAGALRQRWRRRGRSPPARDPRASARARPRSHDAAAGARRARRAAAAGGGRMTARVPHGRAALSAALAGCGPRAPERDRERPRRGGSHAAQQPGSAPGQRRDVAARRAARLQLA